MNLERAHSSHLPTLTELLENYSQTTGAAITVFAHVAGGELTDLSLSDEQGKPITPAAFMSNLVIEFDRLLAARALPAECDVRLQTSQQETHPAGSNTPAESGPGDPGDLSGAARVNNDGMALRSALLKLGHRTGYSSKEIDEASRRQGASLPEIRFYRSVVRQGKVAQGPYGDVVSSDLQADFAASALEGKEAQLPPASPQDLVQPLLSHTGWIELAHDSTCLYAADLAPGASGKIGQIIGRTIGQAQPPFLVAHSLAQFVTGDWVEDSRQKPGWQASSQASQLPWQAVASILEPSKDTASFFEVGGHKQAAQEGSAVTAVTAENGEVIESWVAKNDADRELKSSATAPSQEFSGQYRSQIKDLLDRQDPPAQSQQPDQPPSQLTTSSQENLLLTRSRFQPGQEKRPANPTDPANPGFIGQAGSEASSTGDSSGPRQVGNPPFTSVPAPNRRHKAGQQEADSAAEKPNSAFEASSPVWARSAENKQAGQGQGSSPARAGKRRTATWAVPADRDPLQHSTPGPALAAEKKQQPKEAANQQQNQPPQATTHKQEEDENNFKVALRRFFLG
ncbi:MAG: hypothetical protein Q4C74_06925 [Rothia sp. (in: high G+C Gram-positive bacteria)]|nr:hypothetical protein [Rothia sp. (in: high G+C Gram-positive bacteria)]